MRTDPILAPPGTDDATPDEFTRARLIFSARYTALRCRSCEAPILLGPVVCPDCAGQGYCTICGEEHPPTRCPLVVRVRMEMVAAERAMHKQIVKDWAGQLQARYKAEPVAC